MPKLLIIQSGGPTAVLNASLAGVVAGVRDLPAGRGFDGVIGARRGVEGILDGSFVDLSGMDTDQWQRLAHTPSAALGTTRYRPAADELQQIIATCARQGIAAIVAIGGNDTADTIDRLVRAAAGNESELRCVAIPKTIDNDLVGTHYSLGYASAAGFVAEAVRAAAIDTVSTANLYPVKFVEVMGRNAGWLAAAGSLGFGFDQRRPLLCLPERPISSCADLMVRIARRIEIDRYAVVVVPETLRWADGSHVAGDEPEWVDQFGHPYFPSAGQALSRMVMEQLGLRARYDKPGTIARSWTGRGYEQEARHAFQAGVAAVERLMAGDSGVVLSLQVEYSTTSSLDVRFDTLPLREVANVEHTLPAEMIAASDDDVTIAFAEYANPIIGGEIEPYETLD